jgi:plastocyanin
MRRFDVGLALVLVGATAPGGVAGTVTGGSGPLWVWVDGEVAPVSASVTVDQVQTTFVPNALVVAAGTTVQFRNGGPELHDVYSANPNAYFDLGSYPTGESRPYTFRVPGLVEIGCNKHEWMHLNLLVVPNPWFAKVGADHRFRIAGVPPGPHTLRVWGPKLKGTVAKVVDVGPDGSAAGDVQLVIGP